MANQEAEAAGKKPVYRLIRPRTVIYASLLLLASGVMATALLLRAHLDITVLHERSPLFVRLSDGEFRNGFTIRILNKTYTSARYSLTLHGLADYRVDVVGMEAVGGPRRALTLTAKPDAVATYRLYLTAKRGELHGETTPIVFEIEDQETHEMARHDSIFVGPGK